MKKLFLLSMIILFNTNNSLAFEQSQWNKTLKEITHSVVSIRVNAVRTFDTQRSQSTQATGFVVDAKQGIILTNRHVVNTGPITAEAIFSNNEEVELFPIYRDPVHDFGFFKYDPKALKFIQPQSLKLITNAAKVGSEIKVIGNDSGEHMSILSGTLARLDRSAPHYSRGSYNDFNTFYFQSSADTSGGSSGSPVINIHGQVIALNAGGNNRSSSSFFLPLFKVTQALQAIQQDKKIQRGSILTTLNYKPYDQARRLGLPETIEAKFRKKNKSNGLLIVEKTVFKSVSNKKLRPGDIIISVQSKQQLIEHVSRYEVFETFLDQHVNQTIQLTVIRQGQLKTVSLVVQDLHQITPNEYLQIANGIFNNFSYQLARQTHLPVEGVYISSAGYMFSQAGVGRGAIIQSVNQQKIVNLNDFYNALKKLKQSEQFTLKYVNIGSPNKQKIKHVKFQTNWHLSQRCLRNDAQPTWQCKKIQWLNENQMISPIEAKLIKQTDQHTAKIASSLIMVESNLPYHIDGQNFQHYSGTGLILDAAKGLVLADRNTVPVKMADVKLTIAGTAEIPAKILFVHPTHSFVLLQYNPKLLIDSPLKSAQLSNKPLFAGDSVWLVGYQASNRLISEKLNVSSVEPLSLPASSLPQFRDSNTNSVIINNPPNVASGVLIDQSGSVRSWWTNFPVSQTSNQTINRGLPVDHIIKIRDQWLKHNRVDIYSLEVETRPISIASARNFGLSAKWINQLQNSSQKPQVLKIINRVAGSNAFNQLKNGDLLLAVNDQVIDSFNTLDIITNQSQVKVSVWRDHQLFDFNIQTKLLTHLDTKEAYLWSGALLQKPHRALALHTELKAEGVYISWYWYGSPANRYQLSPLNRIVELEGEAIFDIKQLISISQKYKDKTYLSVRVIDLIGRESIITLKQDHHYWPTQRIFWDGKTWKNELIE